MNETRPPAFCPPGQVERRVLRWCERVEASLIAPDREPRSAGNAVPPYVFRPYVWRADGWRERRDTRLAVFAEPPAGQDDFARRVERARRAKELERARMRALPRPSRQVRPRRRPVSQVQLPELPAGRKTEAQQLWEDIWREGVARKQARQDRSAGGI